MAIAFDASATASSNPTAGSPQTFSHTCSGTNRILFVGMMVRGGTPAVTVTGVTYAGVSMTQVGTGVNYDSTNSRNQIWYLVNPATGANTVSVSVSGNSGPVSSYSVSYTGASQTGVPDASNTNSSSASNVTSLASSVTTVAANCWYLIIGGAVVSGTGGVMSGTVGCSLRIGNTNSGTYLISGILDSNGTVAPGAHSVTINQSGSAAPMGLVIVSFAPVGVTVNSGFLPFM